MRLQGVVGPRQSRDAVEQNDYILAAFHHALGHLNHKFRHLHMAFRRLIKCGAEHLGLGVADHVRHFLGTLIYQQDHQLHFRIVLGNAVGHFLHQDGFAGARRGHNQPSLPLAHRSHQIHHAHGYFRRIHLQHEALIGEKRGQVFKGHDAAGLFGIIVVDLLDFQHREESLFVLWRPDFAQNQIPRAQAKTADLRGRHIDILRAGQIIVDRGAKKPEIVRQNFKDALAYDIAAASGMRLKNLKSQLMLSKSAQTFKLQLISQRQQFGNSLALHLVKIQRHALAISWGFLNSRGLAHRIAARRGFRSGGCCRSRNGIFNRRFRGRGRHRFRPSSAGPPPRMLFLRTSFLITRCPGVFSVCHNDRSLLLMISLNTAEMLSFNSSRLPLFVIT